MLSVLLELSLCVVIVIKMTSSQPTSDIVQHGDDVSTCANEQVLDQLQRDVAKLNVSQLQKAGSELVAVVTTLEKTKSELVTALMLMQQNNNNSELSTAMSQLQLGIVQVCYRRPILN